MFDYTPAKLYDAGGDLSKRWYVYFSVRDDSGKLTLRKRKAGINREKTLKARMRAASELITEINSLLQNGWRDGLGESPQVTGTIKELLTEMVQVKKATLKHRTWQSHKYCMDKFFAWLDKNNYSNLQPIQFTTSHANLYCDFLKRSGFANKTFNYNKDNIKHFFSMLEDREIITRNPFKKIKSLVETPRRHIAFSIKELDKIDKHMKENCYQLYLFSRFVLFCFIRPIEVLRITIGEVDLKNYRIMIHADQAKSSTARVVEIPKPLRPLIKKMNLEKYPSHYSLFSNGMMPGEKPLSRNAVTENFRRWVKVPLNLPVDYTLYGMKHTGNARAFDLGISVEAIRRQNGHATEAQTRTYLRSIGRNPNSEFAQKMK